jgi:hypothetical protein
MNLNSICNIIGRNILPKGALIECINPKGFLKKGIIYEVLKECEIDEETIMVKEVGNTGGYTHYSSFFPSRFKFLSAPQPYENNSI